MNGSAGLGFGGEYDTAFDETDPEIRQGDVLELIATDADDEWESSYGVLITADCDLAHAKHGGTLSYVPVVPSEVYVRHVVVPRVLATAVVESERALQEVLPEGDGWPTSERLREMLDLGDAAEEVIAAIPAGHDAHAAVSTRVRRLHRALLAEREYDSTALISTSLGYANSTIQAIREIEGNKAKPDGQILRTDLMARMTKQLAGDAFFIGSLSPNHSAGHVAYLRLIREIDHDAIAVSAVAERRLGDRVQARRIGRLSLLYLHRLAQQMAQVFTDIGLPGEYEANRVDVVSRLLTQWIEASLTANTPESEP